jgi:hypothetical protein
MPPDPSQLSDSARRCTEAWCSQDSEASSRIYASDGSLTINEVGPSVGDDLRRPNRQREPSFAEFLVWAGQVSNLRPWD